MGLCKCPKKTVTNQFCFVHRVNVCEYCMVAAHPTCIVQSYLRWLQDSDCHPDCTLCSEKLEHTDCVRLTCYHVFHWACLDNYARSLPATTAPAGYTCPTCQSGIFPKPNLLSAVADVLKEKLAGVNWARTGLGLPLLSSESEQKPQQGPKIFPTETTIYQNHSSPAPASAATARTVTNAKSATANHSNLVHAVTQKQGPPYSVVNIESSSQADKKVFEAYDDAKDVMFDHDENKYQRKSAIEMFIRWWKSLFTAPARRRGSPGNLYKRYGLIILIILIFFAFIVILFSWLGRMESDGNLAFDMLANPNSNLQKEASI